MYHERNYNEEVTGAKRESRTNVILSSCLYLTLSLMRIGETSYGNAQYTRGARVPRA
jgi:hypothetical protein